MIFLCRQYCVFHSKTTFWGCGFLHTLSTLNMNSWFCSIPSCAGKAGVIPGEKQCILLKGICKDIACTSTDDTIGECNDEKKCCRKWWVFEPYPTPIPRGKSP
ncbi:Beta-defensin 130 [Microtus ochrogaster]|uniref:Beta-defensin 130 n=1 Tax=Microtus ochrogaster TaxID=79684 RepID=A0A8J6GI66_MICOH|nr:Beta-defensin 130 [Microtus ochrogaster]